MDCVNTEIVPLYLQETKIILGLTARYIHYSKVLDLFLAAKGPTHSSPIMMYYQKL